MTFRTILFWCHLCTGVVAGVVVLIMSVTGVLLMYEKQVTAWADRSYLIAPPSSVAKRLPVEMLLGRGREQRHALPSTLTLRSDRSAPAALGFGREGILFMNPYTGEIVGEGAKGIRAFFRVVTDWHRWLGANAENRNFARAVTGACNLGFFFLLISGFYIWLPRQWTWSQFRNVTWFRRGLPGKARDFNWHNVIGIWLAIPLFIVVLSATVISYPWASNAVYRLVGEEPPVTGGLTGQAREGRVDGGRMAAPPANLKWEDFDRLWSRAEQQVAGWESITLRLPSSSTAPVAFTIDQGNGGQPQKRAQLTLDRLTGEIVRWEPFASMSLGRRLRMVLRFAHTGEVAGLLGQTVAGIATIGASMLVYTGLSLSWRRLRAWYGRRWSQESIETRENGAAEPMA